MKVRLLFDDNEGGTIMGLAEDCMANHFCHSDYENDYLYRSYIMKSFIHLSSNKA